MKKIVFLILMLLFVFAVVYYFFIDNNKEISSCISCHDGIETVSSSHLIYPAQTAMVAVL